MYLHTRVKIQQRWCITSDCILTQEKQYNIKVLTVATITTGIASIRMHDSEQNTRARCGTNVQWITTHLVFKFVSTGYVTEDNFSDYIHLLSHKISMSPTSHSFIHDFEWVKHQYNNALIYESLTTAFFFHFHVTKITWSTPSWRFNIGHPKEIFMIQYKTVPIIYTERNVTLQAAIKCVHPPSRASSVLQSPTI